MSTSSRRSTCPRPLSDKLLRERGSMYEMSSLRVFRTKPTHEEAVINNLLKNSILRKERRDNDRLQLRKRIYNTFRLYIFTPARKLHRNKDISSPYLYHNKSYFCTKPYSPPECHSRATY